MYVMLTKQLAKDRALSRISTQRGAEVSLDIGFFNGKFSRNNLRSVNEYNEMHKVN